MKKKFFLMCSLITLMTTACSNKISESKIESEIVTEVDYNTLNNSNNEDNLSKKETKTLEKTNKAIIINQTNIYLGPSSDYEVLAPLSENTTVSIVSKSLNDWYLVEFNDVYGFINVKDLDLTNTIIPDNYYDVDSKSVVEANTNVNIRENPDVESKKLGLLQYKEQLEVIKKLNNGWYEVNYDNSSAYVNESYVSEVESSNIVNNYYKVICLKEDTMMYTDINKSDSIQLARYECGEVFNETENYYLIKTENTIGYIEKKNLLELDGTFVIVDVSDQKLTLYENNEITLTSNVVTGKDSSPTDLGIEEVMYKQKDRILKGANNSYSTHVNYWMRINNNSEGLHDATWRINFGGDIYKYNGSHGCVNLPLEVAEYLYDKVEVGTRVIVKK